MSSNTHPDYIQLVEIIKEELNIKVLPPMINKHISEMIVSHKMTYKEISRCIVWFTEVQGRLLDIKYGIKQLVNFREPVAEYFAKLKLDEERKQQEAKDMAKNQDNNIIYITNYKIEKRQPKQIDISSLELEEEAY